MTQDPLTRAILAVVAIGVLALLALMLTAYALSDPPARQPEEPTLPVGPTPVDTPMPA